MLWHLEEAVICLEAGVYPEGTKYRTVSCGSSVWDGRGKAASVANLNQLTPHLLQVESLGLAKPMLNQTQPGQLLHDRRRSCSSCYCSN